MTQTEQDRLKLAVSCCGVDSALKQCSDCWGGGASRGMTRLQLWGLFRGSSLCDRGGAPGNMVPGPTSEGPAAVRFASHEHMCTRHPCNPTPSPAGHC